MAVVPAAMPSMAPPVATSGDAGSFERWSDARIGSPYQ
ncbi:hypothetical protein QFZ26_000916 [Agromyces ramosus]|uniref:Uncharacterized protein n=1 Tax=Agromyces ramosus TaxID=33879 RepID=A0ABU0R5K2_9MICO|nr:hypothetical protein [Agromyces ramosus]